MNNYIIKKITKTDIQTLSHWFNNPVALFLSAPHESFPLDFSLLQKKIEQYDARGLFFEEKIIASLFFEENKLTHFFLLPEFRKKKLSKLLLADFQRNSTYLRALVHSARRETIKLFQTMNFLDSGKKEFFEFEETKEAFIEFVWKK
jgi:hypothetical protein